LTTDPWTERPVTVAGFLRECVAEALDLRVGEPIPNHPIEVTEHGFGNGTEFVGTFGQ
jgi:hypothetical protein